MNEPEEPMHYSGSLPLKSQHELLLAAADEIERDHRPVATADPDTVAARLAMFIVQTGKLRGLLTEALRDHVRLVKDPENTNWFDLAQVALGGDADNVVSPKRWPLSYYSRLLDAKGAAERASAVADYFRCIARGSV